MIVYYYSIFTCICRGDVQYIHIYCINFQGKPIVVVVVVVGGGGGGGGGGAILSILSYRVLYIP